MSYTDIQEILSIDVADDEWLGVCNSSRSALEFIDGEKLADYTATRADNEKRTPKCDYCSEPAVFDCKSTDGPWAFMCHTHSIAHAIGLGMGLGTRLETAAYPVKTADDIRNYLDDDFDANELLGLTDKQLLMINIPSLTEYFVNENSNYCLERELCPECRNQLVHSLRNDDEETMTCPEGCI